MMEEGADGRGGRASGCGEESGDLCLRLAEGPVCAYLLSLCLDSRTCRHYFLCLPHTHTPSHPPSPSPLPSSLPPSAAAAPGALPHPSPPTPPSPFQLLPRDLMVESFKLSKDVTIGDTVVRPHLVLFCFTHSYPHLSFCPSPPPLLLSSPSRDEYTFGLYDCLLPYPHLPCPPSVPRSHPPASRAPPPVTPPPPPPSRSHPPGPLDCHVAQP